MKILCYVAMIVLVLAAASTCADQIIGSSMNSGGVSSGVDPDGIRRSLHYAIVDSIGQFAVGTSHSANYMLEHGYWSSEPAISTPPTISAAKGYADGVLLRAMGKVATAGSDKLASRFYIEDSDRTSGLQVRFGPTGGPVVSAGCEVDVLGRLTTVDGERAIEYPYIERITCGQPIPEPWLMLSRSAGGESLNDYTPGVWQGLGPNTVGLLVTVHGSVTYRDEGNGFFYLDDGSGIDDGAGLGIRIICSDLASGNVIGVPGMQEFVRATGIVSTTMVNTRNVRCIRPRDQADVVRIWPPVP